MSKDIIKTDIKDTVDPLIDTLIDKGLEVMESAINSFIAKLKK